MAFVGTAFRGSFFCVPVAFAGGPPTQALGTFSSAIRLRRLLISSCSTLTSLYFIHRDIEVGGACAFGPVYFFFSLFLATALLAQSSVTPDVAEPGSAEEIAKATTSPQFLSPWVSYLPASSTVPSPRAFYRRMLGAPGELVNAEKAYEYCRALAAASPRVRVFTIGRSEEGREIILLAIADEKGIQDLEKLKAANRLSC